MKRVTQYEEQFEHESMRRGLQYAVKYWIILFVNVPPHGKSWESLLYTV
jgi:hypothetical protein